jgi:NitT/TauT family transport system substrate-binding protein
VFMKNIKKGIFLIVLILVTLSGSLIGCTQPASTTPDDVSLPDGVSQSENKLQTVRFGYFPISYLLPVYVAQEKGFFEDNGLKAEMTELSNSSEIMAAMSAGQLDVGSMSFISTVLARKQGVPIVLTGSFGYAQVGQALNGLCVLADSLLTKMEDLSGTTIGGPMKGGEPWFWVMDALETNGITDYQYIELRTPDNPVSLKAGTIDAAFLQEPQITMMGDEVMMIADLGNITGACGYAFNEKFISENPEAVSMWFKSLGMAVNFIQEHEEEARSILSQYTHVPSEIAMSAILPSWDEKSRILIDEAEREVEWMQKYDLIDESPDLNDVFNFEFTGKVNLEDLREQ